MLRYREEAQSVPMTSSFLANYLVMFIKHSNRKIATKMVKTKDKIDTTAQAIVDQLTEETALKWAYR